MKNLRRKFERFCFQNRNTGIPNLMLYIVIGNAVVYIMSTIAGNGLLYDILCFDRTRILQGQLWRLVTYVLTCFPGGTNPLLALISMFCYYSLGRAMENVWGTLRFNLFYLTGMLLMDIFAMTLGGILIPYGTYLYDLSSLYSGMGYYLNLSLFISYATLYPDAHFLLFFIIPVKAWIFALFDLIITFYEVWSLSYPVNFFPHNLFPLIGLANYFLFFGKDVLNVIPVSWRANFRRLFRKKPKTTYKPDRPKVIPFPDAGSYEATTATVKAPYTHRCTICGRTDTEYPDLEFRYCSRCKGYYCYCEDHISSHTHIQ